MYAPILDEEFLERRRQERQWEYEAELNRMRWLRYHFTYRVEDNLEHIKGKFVDGVLTLQEFEEVVEMGLKEGRFSFA